MTLSSVVWWWWLNLILWMSDLCPIERPFFLTQFDFNNDCELKRWSSFTWKGHRMNHHQKLETFWKLRLPIIVASSQFFFDRCLNFSKQNICFLRICLQDWLIIPLFKSFSARCWRPGLLTIFSISDDKLRSNVFLLLILVWEDGGKKKSRLNGDLPSKKQQVIGPIVWIGVPFMKLECQHCNESST